MMHAAIYCIAVVRKEMEEMHYVVGLYFDEETEKQIDSLVQKIADAGISTKLLEWNARPHITLGCFNDIDEEKCIEKLKKFAGIHQVVPAYIDSIGMFNDTRTIFLSPTMNRSMYQLHSDLHECLEGFDKSGWEWYCPDGWVPHCTVALTREDSEEAFYKASELVLREFRKIKGEYVSLGLGKMVFPVEEIVRIDLRRGC